MAIDSQRDNQYHALRGCDQRSHGSPGARMGGEHHVGWHPSRLCSGNQQRSLRQPHRLFWTIRPYMSSASGSDCKRIDEICNTQMDLNSLHYIATFVTTCDDEWDDLC